MPDEKLKEVFNQLRTILQVFEPKLILKTDKPAAYYLEAPFSEKYGRELFFGSVQIRKNYVSFYLFPVYMFPDLLENISPALKKRMQGKSCFNFKEIDQGLFRELKQLAKKGFDRFKKEKLV